MLAKNDTVTGKPLVVRCSFWSIPDAPARSHIDDFAFVEMDPVFDDEDDGEQMEDRTFKLISDARDKYRILATYEETVGGNGYTGFTMYPSVFATLIMAGPPSNKYVESLVVDAPKFEGRFQDAILYRYETSIEDYGYEDVTMYTSVFEKLLMAGVPGNESGSMLAVIPHILIAYYTISVYNLSNVRNQIF